MNQRRKGFKFKKRYLFTVMLLFWAGIILYLSFQNGTDTAATSAEFTQGILRLLHMDVNDWDLVMLWDHRFRILAHVGTLFV